MNQKPAPLILAFIVGLILGVMFGTRHTPLILVEGDSATFEAAP